MNKDQPAHEIPYLLLLEITGDLQKPSLKLQLQAIDIGVLQSWFLPFSQPKIVQGEGAITSGVIGSMSEDEKEVQSMESVWWTLLERFNLHTAEDNR